MIGTCAHWCIGILKSKVGIKEKKLENEQEEHV